MTPYLVSVALVVLAEMGDKTQLLAVAFSCRYPWKTVLWAIFWGSLSNHFLAVLAGGFLMRLIPEGVLQGGAALAFILFGLWTLGDDGSSEEDRASSRGPFMTVFVAFFLAEMGDKTQLTSVALAARFGSLLPVWLGATTGMMIANGLAVLAGSTVCRRLPERQLRLVAALCFMVFGLVGLVPIATARGVPPALLLLAAVILAVLFLLLYRRHPARPDRECPCRRDDS